jgi:hypothetical protein
VIVICNILSHERICLSFTIAAGPRQRSHSQVRVQLNSRPYFTVSDRRVPQTGGSGPRIYIPQALGSLLVAYYDSQEIFNHDSQKAEDASGLLPFSGYLIENIRLCLTDSSLMLLHPKGTTKLQVFNARNFTVPIQ